ncbi:MAG: hypothetical protein EPO35_03130, partial [Acidobacteria bacterium]
MRTLATRLSRATRRRLLVCAAVAVLALPTEAALVAAIGAPASDTAARDWAESLSPNDLQDALRGVLQ